MPATQAPFQPPRAWTAPPPDPGAAVLPTTAGPCPLLVAEKRGWHSPRPYRWGPSLPALSAPPRGCGRGLYEGLDRLSFSPRWCVTAGREPRRPKASGSAGSRDDILLHLDPAPHPRAPHRTGRSHRTHGHHFAHGAPAGPARSLAVATARLAPAPTRRVVAACAQGSRSHLPAATMAAHALVRIPTFPARPCAWLCGRARRVPAAQAMGRRWGCPATTHLQDPAAAISGRRAPHTCCTTPEQPR